MAASMDMAFSVLGQDAGFQWIGEVENPPPPESGPVAGTPAPACRGTAKEGYRYHRQAVLAYGGETPVHSMQGRASPWLWMAAQTAAGCLHCGKHIDPPHRRGCLEPKVWS